MISHVRQLPSSKDRKENEYDTICLFTRQVVYSQGGKSNILYTTCENCLNSMGLDQKMCDNVRGFSA